jgi:hypothetical protein
VFATAQAFVNPNNAAVIATLLRVDPHLENLAGWSQIRATLVRLPYWDMDVFKLKADLGQHCVVAVVGLSLMCKLGLLETLPLDEQEIYSYLKWVGKSMFDNPYHNSCHVADVMHSVGLILYSRSTKDVSASVRLPPTSRLPFSRCRRVRHLESRACDVVTARRRCA